MRGKRTLVTGGAGFIGSHLADRLIAEGHQVFIADDLSKGLLENVPERAEFLRLDLMGPGIESALAWARPEVIVHLAAQIDLRTSFRNPAEDCEKNVLMTLRLFQAGAHSGVRHFVFASSGGAIYGEAAAGPQSESHLECPLSPYGVSKLAADHYLRALSDASGCRAVSLRFANVYGPRQGMAGEAGVVGLFAKRLAEGKPLTIHGDGLQTRDFVHVKDLAAAVSLALAAEATGIYNLGTGIETSVLDLATQLCRIAGSSAPLNHGPAIAHEQRRSVLDPSKARKELGWAPSILLDAGLRETWEWFRDREQLQPR